MKQDKLSLKQDTLTLHVEQVPKPAPNVNAFSFSDALILAALGFFIYKRGRENGRNVRRDKK